MDFQKITRRNFLKGSMAAAAAGSLGVAAYSRRVEPQELSIERREVFLSRLRPELDGFLIALLCDLHYGVYIDHVLKSAVQAANAAKPDLVLLGGDFNTWHHTTKARLVNDANTCAQILSQMESRCGTLAVLGNHDYSVRASIVTDALTNRGITILQNAAFPVERNNFRLWVGGIDDILEGKPDLAATLKGIPVDEPKILLAHEPDFADYVKSEYQVDLQLSGHSHGGQVRVPLLGAPILPALGRKYPMGFYRVGNMQLYTNRGLGMGSPRIRFNCPPELTLLTLRSAPSPIKLV